MFRPQNQAVLAKVEAAYGSDSSPDGANDALEAGEVDIAIDHQRLDRIAVRASLAKLKYTFGRSKLSLTIPCELKGSGALGTPPDIGPLLQACAWKETPDPGVDVEYTRETDSTAHKSATIVVNVDGIQFKGTGMRGNFQSVMSATGVPGITFTVEGRLLSITDVAIPATTVQTTVPVQVESMGVTIGAFAAGIIRDISLSSQNEIQERPDINSAKGFYGVVIGQQDPMIAMTIEAELEATHPFWADTEDRVERAIAATLGTQAGNIVSLAVPNFSPYEIRPNRNGQILEYQISGQASESTVNAGDNATLTFA